MKIRLTFVPGFSEALAGWSATLLVGGGGSVSCHWWSGSVSEERSKSSVPFRLNEAQFTAAWDALLLLSDPVLTVGVDDTPSRRIQCSGDAGELSRERIVWPLLKGRDVEAAKDFDHVWAPFFSVIRPVLIEIGMPERLVAQAS